LNIGLDKETESKLKEMLMMQIANVALKLDSEEAYTS
jgi:hypothetical protein